MAQHLTGETFKEYLMGKYKIKDACYVFSRPKNKKFKWGVFNSVTKSEFIFKKKRHAHLVAECLNKIYKLEQVDTGQKSE